jgi:hypothetical protein
MALIRFVLILLSLGLITVSLAIRYDAVSIPIITQLAAGSEFEWALIAYALALAALVFSRARR